MKTILITFCCALALGGGVFWYFTSYQEGVYGRINAHNQPLIVFDFDGTLCDSWGVLIELYNKLCPEYGTKPITNMKEARNSPLQQTLKMHKVSLWKQLLIKHKLTQMGNAYVDKAPSFAGLHAVLKELKKRGYKMGVLTSNSYDNVSQFLAKEGIFEIDFIYYGCSLFGKARLLQKIKAKAKPSVMFSVGDENRDIEAAHKAGITSVAVTWGYQSGELLSQYKPTHIVYEPAGLLAVLPHKE